MSGCEALVCVSGSLHKTAVSCCFFLLIFNTLENNLKTSLKKFAKSKKRCIFVSTKTIKQ